MKKIEIGDHVIYVDSVGTTHSALVQAIWGDPEGTPAINVIIISGDSKKTDQYGRQTEHFTSVVYKEQQQAHGFYWERSSE